MLDRSRCERKKIKLLIISDQQLGKGTHKIVYEAQNIDVSLKVKGKNRDVSRLPKALEKIKKTDSFSLKTIEGGRNLLREILNLQSKSTDIQHIKITLLSVERLPGVDGQKTKSKEFSNDWFNGDLAETCLVRKVPLDIGPNPPMLNLNEIQLMSTILDVSSTVDWLHSIGYVHRDVKAQNIFLKVVAQDLLEGYLSDFDLVCKMGVTFTPLERGYPYWDKGAEAGYPSLFTDYFGLTMALWQILLTGFRDICKKYDSINDLESLKTTYSQTMASIL